jgi:hypothetical protein
MNQTVVIFAKALLRFLAYFTTCFAASLTVAFLAYRAKSAGNLSVEDDAITLFAVGAFCVTGLAFIIFEGRQHKLRASKEDRRGS